MTECLDERVQADSRDGGGKRMEREVTGEESNWKKVTGKESNGIGK